jgi:hypothetical protein
MEGHSRATAYAVERLGGLVKALIYRKIKNQFRELEFRRIPVRAQRLDFW